MSSSQSPSTPDPDLPQQEQVPRPTSPSSCTICMEPLTPQNACLLNPCTHTFDLSCIQSLLLTAGPQGRQCPLCRARISEVLYDHSVEEGYHGKIEVGAAMPESPLRSGFGIRDDEEIQEGMTQEEKDRAFELRRLRGMDDYSGAWSRCWIQGYVEEGENFVLLQRTVGIKIVQSGTITASKLVREVTIRTVRQDLGVVDTLGMSVLPKAEVERAREEIKRVLAGLGTLDTVSPFVRLEMERPSRTVIDDEKGLMVSTSKSHSVLMGNECENGNVSVENMTVVRENLPSKIMGADETDPDMIEGLGRVERVQGVRLARQEMRGVWETFREEEGWRELEARTTGIAGASLEEEGLECEYCEVRHRNGNCLLPREVVAS